MPPIACCVLGCVGSSEPLDQGFMAVLKFRRLSRRRNGLASSTSCRSTLTSGLVAAMGAIGLEPGDEVIVTPWTMVATATAILHWNAIPVFADIDPETFNLDPKAVEAAITPRTRAIAAVDIFGQSADMPALRAIADRHGLKLVTDTAQALVL